MKQKLTGILNGVVVREIRARAIGENFLVIANFAYEEDRVTQAPINIYSGLSGNGFDALIGHSAKAHGVATLYADGNTAVLRGAQESLESVERECGLMFSYAYCSQENAAKVIQRCREAEAETSLDRELRHIPGARDLVRHLN